MILTDTELATKFQHLLVSTDISWIISRLYWDRFAPSLDRDIWSNTSHAGDFVLVFKVSQEVDELIFALPTRDEHGVFYRSAATFIGDNNRRGQALKGWYAEIDRNTFDRLTELGRLAALGRQHKASAAASHPLSHGDGTKLD